MSERESPQLVVLGSGVEPNWAEFPGTVQDGSPYSDWGYRRAVRAAQYIDENPAVERIILTGCRGFKVPEADWSNVPESEALLSVDALTNVIERRGIDVITQGSPKNNNTYWNWILARPHLNLQEPIAFVTSPTHIERATNIGLQVIPEGDFVGIASEPTPPDLDKGSVPIEKAANALYWACMFGREPGDIKSIIRGDFYAKDIARMVFGAKDIIGNLLGRSSTSESRLTAAA